MPPSKVHVYASTSYHRLFLWYIILSRTVNSGWFSGHFHLGQDYQDSITVPQNNNRGSCVFAQTSVMSRKSTRDSRRQSRLLRGNKDGFQICTINHAKDGEERVDLTVTYTPDSKDIAVDDQTHEDYDHDKFFSAYSPREEDGCYLEVRAYSLQARSSSCASSI